MSISNQKRILEKSASDLGLTNIRHFTDDGISGLRFDRPGFVSMMNEIENGNVSAILVKDMSRLGRDYLKVGYYTELFRQKDIRLIAVNDAVDTSKGDDEFAPFRNIMNEWYARDTSKKIRSAYKAKNLAGKHLCTSPAFGYVKSEKDNNQWIIDPEAAEVVRKIYAMALEGKGPYQIRQLLSQQHIEIPAHYLKKKNIGLWKSREVKDPYNWCVSTVKHILEDPEYTGCTCNFKTRKHFKDKKSHYVPMDQWSIIPDTHEPIIDRNTFETVQRMRSTKRYPDGFGEVHPLTGLMFCADCGSKMYVHRVNNGKRIPQFTCPAFAKQPCGTLCATQHRIHAEDVLLLIQETLKEIITFSQEDEDAFIRSVNEAVRGKTDTKAAENGKKLETAQKRIDELETLLCRIYEDNALGKLPDSRFNTLNMQYTDEQNRLKKEISSIQPTVTEMDTPEVSADKFIALVKKYSNFETLTIPMLNEFIEKILVHEREIKYSRFSPQTIEIFFNFVGDYRIPGSSVPLTAEEQEQNSDVDPLLTARREKLKESSRKRIANGSAHEYYEKTKDKYKAKMDEANARIKAEDIENGVFYYNKTVNLSLPQENENTVQTEDS